MIDLSHTQNETTEKQTTYPWVIISLSNKLFGISSEMVTSMELLPTITEVPHSPNYMRGMIESRGKMLPLIDARIKLGYTSLKSEMKELGELFQKRKKEHEAWIEELEQSIIENRAFRKSADSHQCEFGKWYDNYQTDNFAFLHVLKKFKKPHEELHETANEISKLKREKNTDAIEASLQKAKNILIPELNQLFDKASSLALEETREIMLVVELNSKEVALTVDTVTSVEYLAKDTVQDIPTSNSEEAKFSSQIGKRANGKDNVILLDFNKIDIQGITNLIHSN